MGKILIWPQRCNKHAVLIQSNGMSPFTHASRQESASAFEMRRGHAKTVVRQARRERINLSLSANVKIRQRRVGFPNTAVGISYISPSRHLCTHKRNVLYPIDL
jgi:hypothetical protein